MRALGPGTRTDSPCPRTPGAEGAREGSGTCVPPRARRRACLSAHRAGVSRPVLPARAVLARAGSPGLPGREPRASLLQKQWQDSHAAPQRPGLGAPRGWDGQLGALGAAPSPGLLHCLGLQETRLPRALNPWASCPPSAHGAPCTAEGQSASLGPLGSVCPSSPELSSAQSRPCWE